MSDRITEAPGPLPIIRESEIPLLDDAIPLIRDEPWQWFAVFLDPDGQPSDISGAGTPSAKLRWEVGEVDVTVAPVAGATGQLELTLTAEQTAAMPFGQLLRLFLALGDDTEAVIPVNVLEGISS